jgi:hypothetical protein
MGGGGAGTTTDCQIADCFFSETGAASATLYALQSGSSFVGNYNAIGVIDGSAL